jgi:hypothetical protein
MKWNEPAVAAREVCGLVRCLCAGEKPKRNARARWRVNATQSSEMKDD